MKILILLSAIIPLYAQAAGGTVENGGDAVFCREEIGTNPPIEVPKLPNDKEWWESLGFKFYNRDYIRSLMSGYLAADFAAIESWNESKERIERILRHASPKLHDSFSDFLLSVKAHAFHYPERRWVAFGGKLVQQGREKYPRNCRAAIKIDNTILLVNAYMRAVTRKKNPDRITYYYDPKVIQGLQKNSALQYSFLMVHEWLWDHTGNAEKNRRVNAFLHSQKAEKMSAFEVRIMLLNLGLKP